MSSGTHRIIHETDAGFLCFEQNGVAGGAIHFASIDVGVVLTAAEFTVICRDRLFMQVFHAFAPVDFGRRAGQDAALAKDLSHISNRIPGPLISQG